MRILSQHWCWSFALNLCANKINNIFCSMFHRKYISFSKSAAQYPLQFWKYATHERKIFVCLDEYYTQKIFYPVYAGHLTKSMSDHPVLSITERQRQKYLKFHPRVTNNFYIVTQPSGTSDTFRMWPMIITVKNDCLCDWRNATVTSEKTQQ